tara:strand:- start:14256 stop:14813 length:558 start_codon:yes stop_codon:yes gene_type:complete
MSEYRSDHLTAATFRGYQPTEDFTDLIHEAEEDRIHAALTSGNLRAVFNGASAASQADDPSLFLALLQRAFQQACDVEQWDVVDEAEIDIATALEMVQFECLESLALCGEEAVALLASVLQGTNDTLMFSVLNGIKASADSVFVPIVHGFKQELEHLAVHADSVSHLNDAANEALAACSSELQQL